MEMEVTRTTRVPVFWEYPRHPMITHIIDPYWNKTRQSQSYKFKGLAKTSNIQTFIKIIYNTPSEVA